MKRDSDFVCFTRQVKIPRAAIVTVQPRARGGARVFTTAHGKQGVLVMEDYAVVMERLYGGGTERAPLARPARGLSELAAQFQDKDESLTQILLALHRRKGRFTGTAGDLSREISRGLPHSALRRLVSPGSVGISLRRNIALLGKYLVVRVPRLREGRTVYFFDGLQPGVES